MSTTIKVTVSQPLPSMPNEPEYKPEELKKKKSMHDPDSEFPKLAPPPNRPLDERPFIKNEVPCYTDEPFLKGEGIDIYVDG